MDLLRRWPAVTKTVSWLIVSYIMIGLCTYVESVRHLGWCWEAVRLAATASLISSFVKVPVYATHEKLWAHWLKRPEDRKKPLKLAA